MNLKKNYQSAFQSDTVTGVGKIFDNNRQNETNMVKYGKAIRESEDENHGVCDHFDIDGRNVRMYRQHTDGHKR